MSLFGKPKAGGFMDEIRCDEPSYLIWKWHPAGSVAENNNRENAIRWGSSLRVKDGEVAVFVYRQSDGTMQDFIVGPFDKKIETSNFPVLASIVGFAYAGGTPFQAEVYKIIDDFQAGPTDIRVLVLDRDYEFLPVAERGIAIIDGVEYPFQLNSIPCWATIRSHDSFTGKTVEFC